MIVKPAEYNNLNSITAAWPPAEHASIMHGTIKAFCFQSHK